MEEEPWKPQQWQHPSLFQSLWLWRSRKGRPASFCRSICRPGVWNSIVPQFVNKKGWIYVSVDMEKSWVRRLRSIISVPKLQLVAATLLIQMNGLTERKYECRIEANRVIFWTDPAIVPKYILVEKRFITFFAVIGGWRHIRSKVHTADYASKDWNPVRLRN